MVWAWKRQQGCLPSVIRAAEERGARTECKRWIHDQIQVGITTFIRTKGVCWFSTSVLVHLGMKKCNTLVCHWPPPQVSLISLRRGSYFHTIIENKAFKYANITRKKKQSMHVSMKMRFKINRLNLWSLLYWVRMSFSEIHPKCSLMASPNPI